ncbi:hypothetical protein BD769DRAFT_1391016 [Suillus cothurnatus]|nr:hypothetical protein BD769DRAFT_1391016 [Suillus cothurnatus]
MTSQLSEHCFIAISHSGTPVGHQEEIANVQTYVSEPTNSSESKGVVLYFSDVFWSLSSSMSSFDTYLFLGFCFGAPHVFNLAKDGGLIVCGTIAYPATPSENLTEINECTSTRSPKTRQKVEDRLVEQKKTHYVQIFSGMKHGSAVRYDSNAENERWERKSISAA